MFSATSDPILQAALWAGLIALALTAVMALAIVLLRLALLRDQQRWDRFVQTWRPLLLALMMDDEVAAADGLPPLLPRDRQRFLRLWVYLHESVRGDAATGFELDIITMVLLGGVSIFGGRGTIIGVLFSILIVLNLRRRP